MKQNIVVTFPHPQNKKKTSGTITKLYTVDYVGHGKSTLCNVETKTEVLHDIPVSEITKIELKKAKKQS